jgi:hypothetical protein
MPEEIPSDIKWLGRLLCATILYTSRKAYTPRQACEIADEFIISLEPPLDFDAWARANVPIAKSWAEGIKFVTGVDRPARARKRFSDWSNRLGISETLVEVVHPTLNTHFVVKRKIGDWRQGFTEMELQYFEQKFAPFRKNSLHVTKATQSRETARKSKKPTKG